MRLRTLRRRYGRALAPGSPKSWVVAARTVVDLEVAGPRRSPYEQPPMREIQVPRALVWRKGVVASKLAAEVAKAEESLRPEGYKVFTYPSSERDPLGRAKKEMMAGP